jgi:hypothetical protein
MTWSYDGDPAGSTLDAVRYLIQDTDEDDQQLQDEEIDYQLSVDGAALTAAVSCCRVLSARYAGKATSKQVGDLKLEHGDRSKRYLDLARELETRGTATVVSGMAGGISVAAKNTAADDTDRTRPAFYRGLTDHPSAPGRDIAGLWGETWST